MYLKRRLVSLQNIGVGLEDAEHFQKQIAEVGGIHHLQPRLVFRIELTAHAIGKTVGFTGRHLFRHKAAVFPAVNEMGKLAGGPAFFINVMGGEELLEKPDLVIRIENGKAGFEPRQFRMIAQDLDSDGMEGAKPGHAFHHFADEVADALLHFARRLVGEGHRQHLAGPGLVGGQDMSQPCGEHTGFSRARASQHEQGAFGRFDRVALLGIQALEISGFAARHGACRNTCRGNINRLGSHGV